MDSTQYRNPVNGYEVRTSEHPGIWVLLFGPLYFAKHGAWGHAVISAVVAFATFGLSWLVYPFFGRAITRDAYLRRGWTEVRPPGGRRGGGRGPSRA